MIKDIADRQKSIEKKQGNANSWRLKGNNQYRVKKFNEALSCYMEGLKLQPYDISILMNIAQVIRLYILMIIYFACNLL